MTTMLYDLTKYMETGTVHKTELPDVLPVTDLTLRPIQEGADRATNFLRVPPLLIAGLHYGYDFQPVLHADIEETYEAGDSGVGDFLKGFGLVGETVTERVNVSRLALLAYGAYGAAKVMLPDVIEANEARSELFAHIVEAYASRKGISQDVDAAEAVIGQAAAGIALGQIMPELIEVPMFHDQLDETVRKTGLVTGSQEVASYFKRRLRAAPIHQLAGRGQAFRPRRVK